MQKLPHFNKKNSAPKPLHVFYGYAVTKRNHLPEGASRKKNEDERKRQEKKALHMEKNRIKDIVFYMPKNLTNAYHLDTTRRSVKNKIQL